MLLSLGLGSQIGILEGMIGPLFDIPSLKGVKKPVITGNNLSSADLRQCIAKYYHCRRIIAGIRTHVDCTTSFFSTWIRKIMSGPINFLSLMPETI